MLHEYEALSHRGGPPRVTSDGKVSCHRVSIPSLSRGARSSTLAGPYTFIGSINSTPLDLSALGLMSLLVVGVFRPSCRIYPYLAV